MENTRLLIVDDEALFRELLSRRLLEEQGMEIVAEAEDGETAVRLARKYKPDVVLMDIELVGPMDGITAALAIKEERLETGVVILSSHRDRRYVTSLPLEASYGWAYLLKQTVPDIATVVRTINGCKAGMVVLDPAVMSSLRPKAGSPIANLTARQQEVLTLLAEGYKNSVIANKLSLSEKTVETYINVIYQELGISNMPEIHARVRATILFLENSRDDN